MHGLAAWVLSSTQTPIVMHGVQEEASPSCAMRPVSPRTKREREQLGRALKDLTRSSVSVQDALKHFERTCDNLRSAVRYLDRLASICLVRFKPACVCMARSSSPRQATGMVPCSPAVSCSHDGQGHNVTTLLLLLVLPRRRARTAA